MSIFDQFLRHADVVTQPNSKGEAKAWCPWHPDKEGGKPSLGINVQKEIVKCFRCERGSIKELAEAWGIPLSDGSDAPPWERQIDRTYDYLNADGSLRFQVVRFTPKSFAQRRPDPDRPGQWLWNLKSLSPVLYNLPALRDADKDVQVWFVEGEKDADRLKDLGLLATTNPMGANKWRSHYAKEFRGRPVAIIPDNDGAGLEHADKVASVIYEEASAVKVVKLPDLPDKGDVSDWLDDGRTVDDLNDLLSRTPAWERPRDDEDDTQASERPEWKISNLRPYAETITGLLSTHGYFVNGDSAAYFFDQDLRLLLNLDKDDRDLRVLLSDRYQINRQDQLYAYLLEHLMIEAHQRGRNSLVRQFSYYDTDTNTVYLDMGGGRVLKIAETDIDVRDNGADGVLFLPMPDQEPWQYDPSHKPRLLYDTLIRRTNFTDEGVFSVMDQRLLMEMWLVSMAFESMMPTKVITMAVGPGESGKSTLLRTCGRLLIGPTFDVDSILHDQKGEDDFWVNLSHSFFVAYDNVDQVVRWLPDALAQVATGVRRSKRQLHTTHSLSRFNISCMLGVTARTPSVSLRREDVAGRTLIFNLKPLASKRAEFEIQIEIDRLRDLLMSDYAHTVQKTLRVPLSTVKVADPGMRMADFARVATRIGMGLGDLHAQKTDEVMGKVRAAQHEFATEEDSLATLLGLWIGRSKPPLPGEMDLGPTPNNGRNVTPTELMAELNALAKELDMRFRVASPGALGTRLANLEAALSREYEIERDRTNRTRTWSFTVRKDPEIDELHGAEN